MSGFLEMAASVHPMAARELYTMRVERNALQARVESAEAERDRMRDALIACRPAVLRDLEEAARLADDFKGGAIRQACADRADHGRALLDTIDAAAKGQ